jgi:hypothetical protein
MAPGGRKCTRSPVRVSVDRLGQRTTEHNRRSSPPGSRKLTEYNGVAKAKGWKISFPRNRVGKFRFWQRTARWTRENKAGCAQRQHGIGATRRHLQELQQKVGVLVLGDQDSTNRQTRPRPGARPRGRAGLLRHWGIAPVWPGCGITSCPVRHFCAYYLPPLLHAEFGILSIIEARLCA